jgi:hypothetical protein
MVFLRNGGWWGRGLIDGFGLCDDHIRQFLILLNTAFLSKE